MHLQDEQSKERAEFSVLIFYIEEFYEMNKNTCPLLEVSSGATLSTKLVVYQAILQYT